MDLSVVFLDFGFDVVELGLETGIVVPSMPVMRMMAMMMAPAMPVAAAPYPAPVAAPYPAPVAPPAPTCMTQDQLVRALSIALAKEGGAGSPNMTTEERLADLERRVSKLEGQTKALEGKHQGHR